MEGLVSHRSSRSADNPIGLLIADRDSHHNGGPLRRRTVTRRSVHE